MATNRYQFSGARIRELRLKRGLTMEELAADVGKHRSTLWVYEKDRQSPPADTLADIAHRLAVAPGAFFVKDGR